MAVPRTLLLAFALAAAGPLAGCLESDDSPGGGAPFDESVRDLGRGAGGSAVAGTRVIGDAAAWQTWWRDANGCEEPAACEAAPQVDFATERVVAVALGQRPNACHGAAIASARTDPAKGVTTVVAIEATPAPDAFCAQMITYPWAAAAIPKRDTRVEFTIDKRTAPGAGGEEPAPSERDLETRTLAKGAQSGVRSAETRAVTSESEWRSLWKRHAAGTSPTPPVPEVDFAKERVLAVFIGERPSGGWSVAIEEAVVRGGSLEVRAVITPPDGPATAVVTAPFHVVAVPAGSEEATFTVEGDVAVTEGGGSRGSGGSGDGGSGIATRDLGRGHDSGVAERRQVVVADEAAWEALWAEHVANRIPKPEAPRVDFGSERVLAVFAGEKPSGGYAIRVSSVRAEGDGVVAEVLATSPEPGMGTAAVITTPYHFVAIPAGPEPVDFRPADA